MCSFLWADNYCTMSHSQMHLEQMMTELIEEGKDGIWNRNRRVCGGQAPDAGEGKEDRMIKTKKKGRRTSFPLRKVSKFLGTSSQLENRKRVSRNERRKPTQLGGEMHQQERRAVERIKCERMAGHVHSYFCVCCESWSWSEVVWTRPKVGTQESSDGFSDSEERTKIRGLGTVSLRRARQGLFGNS